MHGLLTSESDPRATILDALLAEERSLTAVERFSRVHDRPGGPAQARYYRDLLPAAPPAPGQQYAFEVDLDQCSGCKACVTACHALNGLEEGETWRSVGLLITSCNTETRNPEPETNPKVEAPNSDFAIRSSFGLRTSDFGLQQHVTTACHHCVDPACLNGCPVLAYDKDPRTGIVRHLDDQCIGCRYCVMMCPYEVPRYSDRLGIVRKCDLCSQRLALGEAPACVQACPNGAIRITLVEPGAVRREYRQSAPGPPKSEIRNPKSETPNAEPTVRASIPGARNLFLPGSPDPAITLPTTRYRSRRGELASLAAADAAALKPAEPHVPLVFLLVFSQMAAGLAVFAAAGLVMGGNLAAPALAFPASLIALLVALAVAPFHLGQPRRAWRAFLGWRTSWFSREVVAFGAFAAPLTAAALAQSRGAAVPPALGLLTAAAGLLAVGCSVMIYAATRREFWSLPRTALRFFGTAALLGAAAVATLAALRGLDANAAWLAAMILGALKLAVELAGLRHARAPGWTPLQKSARLLMGPLRRVGAVRLILGALGGVLLPALLVAEPLAAPAPVACLSLALLVLAELLERHLFFVAVAPAKMPGGV